MKKDNRDLFVELLEKVKSLAEVVKSAKVMSQILTREIPVILEQPEDYTGVMGEEAYFTVIAENIASYEWQFRTASGSPNWQHSNITGTYTNQAHVAISTARLKYLYRCKMTGIDGTIIYSNPVKMILEEE